MCDSYIRHLAADVTVLNGNTMEFEGPRSLVEGLSSAGKWVAAVIWILRRF